MKIERNYNLLELNTFGVNVNAAFFVEIKREEELEKLFSLPEFKENKKIFIGGGSNVLFTKNWDGIVVLNKIKGKLLSEKPEDRPSMEEVLRVLTDVEAQLS